MQQNETEYGFHNEFSSKDLQDYNSKNKLNPSNGVYDELDDEYLYLKDNIEQIKNLNIRTFYHKTFTQYLLDYDTDKELEDFLNISKYIQELINYIDEEYLSIDCEFIQNIQYGILNSEDESSHSQNIQHYKIVIGYIVTLITHNLPYIYLKNTLDDVSNLTEAYDIIHSDSLKDLILKEITKKISTIEKLNSTLSKTGETIRNENKKKEFFDMLELLKNNTNISNIEGHYYAKEVVANTPSDKLKELCLIYLERDYKNII